MPNKVKTAKPRRGTKTRKGRGAKTARTRKTTKGSEKTREAHRSPRREWRNHFDWQKPRETLQANDKRNKILTKERVTWTSRCFEKRKEKKWGVSSKNGERSDNGAKWTARKGRNRRLSEPIRTRCVVKWMRGTVLKKATKRKESNFRKRKMTGGDCCHRNQEREMHQRRC